jgi:hypothetical protein
VKRSAVSRFYGAFEIFNLTPEEAIVVVRDYGPKARQAVESQGAENVRKMFEQFNIRP